MEITLTGEWRKAHGATSSIMTIAGHVLKVESVSDWNDRWEWDIHQQTPTGLVWITGSLVISEQFALEAAEQALCAVLGVSVGARSG